MMTTGAFQRST